MEKNLILLFSVLIFSCSSPEEQLLKQTIAAHGAENLNMANVSFDFRDYHYDFDLNNGLYIYTRSITDSLGIKTEDRLKNEGFERLVDGKTAIVADSMVVKYSNSINSVAYFFLLPETLNGPAAMLEVLGKTVIQDKNYQTLKVTFSQNGGGEDFQDEYRYWINEETNEIDFLAYNYETNGGGIRFREAINKRKVNGVLVADYKNYGFETLDHKLDELPMLWSENKIPLLSVIENKNVEIELK